ncbi:Cell wall-associated hydrolase, NlpC family [Maribacter orientalis]|uniref:Cell wall-associated hydrolase, NlpC family n=1 Tax=Maribacter orientalis TaxID=228957 RepID=A0A1H7K112_9FLAO|nr:C40 family peptidase [Maribacter orientalis]SEK79657.1 Cell wall-associated hydrolase, NlpC family [Maribacter orientalis]|tara:strand:+ start:370 stop:936 length:567 start_codon:yes stop_codon:yes gene_type:complete
MRILPYFLIVCFLTSCGSSKKISSSDKERKISVAAANNARTGNITETKTPTEPRVVTNHNLNIADQIINTALSFSGVRYKFGGTTTKGMDCSGLLYVSFGEHDVQLPRTSFHMAEEGHRVTVKNVEKGDLLFFKTSRGSKRINHVGMVVGTDNDEITFIHASTSRGVTVSSLRDGFWNQAFVKATRIL